MSDEVFTYDAATASYNATWEDCLLAGQEVSYDDKHNLVADVRASLPTGKLLNRKRLRLLNTWDCQEFAKECDARVAAQDKVRQYLTQFGDWIAQQQHELGKRVNGTTKLPTISPTREILQALLSHEEPADFLRALTENIQGASYPAELLNTPAVMQRCGILKRQQRPFYKGRLWPTIKNLPDFDVWEWDRELDAYAYVSDRLATVALSTVPEENVDWLWHRYVPLKKLTLVEGDPSAGKTYLLLAIAAAVTQGYCLPDQDGRVGQLRIPASNVLYITAEDGLGDTIVKRAKLCDANLERIFVAPPTSLFPEDLQPFSLARPHMLSAAIEERQASLVILDPLTAFLGAEMDMHRANEVRPVMSRLVSIADRHNCAIVAIRHWTKAMGNKAAYRGQGNIDFFAAARCVLVVGESPEEEGLRVMAQSKNSIDDKGISQVFRITEEGLRWAGTSTITADELSAAQPQRHKKQRQNAMEWLKDFLREGPQPSSTVMEAAKVVGITEKALRRAKEALGVLATKETQAWYWRLPKFQKWDRYGGMDNDDDVPF